MPPQFEFVQELSQSKDSIIYRVIRKEDKSPVILKLLKKDFPSPHEIARFQREFSITKNLDIDGTIKVFELIKYDNYHAIVVEDFGATALNRLLKEREFDLKERLSLAVRIAGILERIHAGNVIHKDINLSNIVWNPESDIVKVIDFGISTELSRETQEVLNPTTLEGTLAYMSPEQTSRMNRDLDYRTDLYSLGVSLYEMFTGTLPFVSTDPMEIVHSHIALIPSNPTLINPNLPSPVSSIILKLLAKDAEERYQSSWTLKKDLMECYRQLQENQEILPFKTAQNDISDRFQIPQKLYGREDEIETLLAAFERICNNSAELVLVSGYSGIGKSSVIHEIHKPIFEKRGLFISGKFEQFKANIPYSSLIQAFPNLIGQILTESEEVINEWKAKLLDVLAPNGQVLCEVIPQIELIIGKQPEVPTLPPLEAQNRFNMVLLNFIGVFSREGQPLTIFLDDLQWADSATLEFIQLLMRDASTKNLLLIGAYRNNELTSGHPLMIALDEIRKTRKSAVSEILLRPLDVLHVSGMLQDILRCGEEKSYPLAEIIIQKTRGNPFFMNQFLKSLYEEGYFTFNTTDRCWEWNLEQISNSAATENVVNFMIRKIKKLDSSPQRAVILASCIGNRFDIELLAKVAGCSMEEILKDVWDAAKEGLIFPMSNSQKFHVEYDNGTTIIDVNRSITLSGNSLSYGFIHDRIQQAAYSFLTDEQSTELHVAIGEHLLSEISPKEEEKRIFEIVNHLNAGKSIINSPDKKLRLATLNLKAGKRAKNSSAFEAALKYLRTGSSLLDNEHWETHYDLMYRINRKQVECEYQNKNFEKAEELFTLLMNHSRTKLQKADICNMRMCLYLASRNLHEAIAVGIEALEMLGQKTPASPTIFHLLREVAVNALLLRKVSIKGILDLPVMENEEVSLATTILTNIAPVAYLTEDKMLYALVGFKAANLSIRHGNSEISPPTYAMVGLMYSSVLGQVETGVAFGEAGIKLLESIKDGSSKAKTSFMFSCMINHWKRPFRNAIPISKKGYQNAIECGDLSFASYNGFRVSATMFMAGFPLKEVINNARHYFECIFQSRDARSKDHADVWLKSYQILQENEPKNLLALYDLKLNEGYKRMEKDFPLGIFNHHVNRARVAWLLGEYQAAKDSILKAEEHKKAALGMFEFAESVYLSCLTLLALYTEASAREQKDFRKRLKKHMKSMKKWAAMAECNFLHKLQLVEAEYGRMVKQDSNLLPLYNKAIANALKNEYIHDAAICHERAYHFCLQEGLNEYANTHLRYAHYLYEQWGATALTTAMERKHPDLKTSLHGTAKSTRKTTQQSALQTGSTFSTVSTSSPGELDMSSILKSTRAISQEILLDRLLEELMQIVLENAGAESGSLILENNGDFFVEAEKKSGDDKIHLQLSVPFSKSKNIAKSVVQLVMRTNENIVIEDAETNSLFSNDPYVSGKKLKSILCMPFSNRGKLIGVIYMENNLTTGAFTTERLETMKILAGQIAASLANAKLYRDLSETKEQVEDYSHTLENKVVERTTELQQTLHELQQSQKKLVLAEKMASLGELVAGVAHEINTPIGICVTSASLLNDYTGNFRGEMENNTLKKSTLEKYVDDSSKCCDLILRNLKRTSDLIKSFKLVAVDQTNYEKRSFELASYLDDIVFSLSPELRQRNQKVSIDAETEIILYSYPGAIAQVITNLIMNSLRHGFDKNQEGEMHISAKKKAEHVCLIYSDNGKGIPAENLKKIYNPFFTTSRADGGTGLGLHIVYNSVVQSLKGTITCKSSPEKGTTFTITIPLEIDADTLLNNLP